MPRTSTPAPKGGIDGKTGRAVNRARLRIIAVCCIAAAQLAGCQGTAAPAAVPQGSVAVYFSPHGGCTEAIVAEIAKARKTVKVQAYSFTSAPIARALVEAKRRGVEVVVVLDKSQRTEKYSSATFLHNEGVPVWIDAKHAIAHNKIILIDGAVVITGSFNFTRAAEEQNAENLLVIHDSGALVAAYVKNFQEHLGHSEKYEGLDTSR
jgi:phosphatidylserine/phosphatidylglycerophosphate/cardiolipin synthase-like enzyme